MNGLVLATRSEDKAREIRQILRPLGLVVVTLAEREVPGDPAEDDLEAFETFRGNAGAKARHFARRLGTPVLADDSGLRVDALGGEPGVRTRRFSGRTDLEGRDLDEANNRLLLDRLAEVPAKRRGARYVCCAAVAWPDGSTLAALGTLSGVIATAPDGTGGFGYDPLFEVPGVGRLAAVPAHAKNAVSHRSRAFRALAVALSSAPWPIRSG